MDERASTSNVYGIAIATKLAVAGAHGTAVAGFKGIARAGDYGIAIAGGGGCATTGEYGKATAGFKGTANAGHHGLARAGHYGTLSIKWHDGKKLQTTVGYIGEGGLEPNTPYQCDNTGKLVKACEEYP